MSVPKIWIDEFNLPANKVGSFAVPDQIIVSTDKALAAGLITQEQYDSWSNFVEVPPVTVPIEVKSSKELPIYLVVNGIRVSPVDSFKIMATNELIIQQVIVIDVTTWTTEGSYQGTYQLPPETGIRDVFITDNESARLIQMSIGTEKACDYIISGILPLCVADGLRPYAGTIPLRGLLEKQMQPLISPKVIGFKRLYSVETLNDGIQNKSIEDVYGFGILTKEQSEAVARNTGPLDMSMGFRSPSESAEDRLETKLQAASDHLKRIQQYVLADSMIAVNLDPISAREV
jgi:hypothetical protein